MILADTQIIESLLDGQIVCRPLRQENIRGSSIDLTIGEWFWRCDARSNSVFNPYDPEEIKRYFAGPFQAKPYASVWNKIGRGLGWPLPFGEKWKDMTALSPFPGIPDDWPVIVLRPQERILAHTHEFVGIHPPGTSEIRARSSTGRVGLTVCKCAGWGDPGYINRWTMEVSNDNDEAIIIPVGERVAQGIFHVTGMPREHYGTERLYESKYQQHGDIDTVVDTWVPQAMLPRNYKDSRVQPLAPDRANYEKALERLANAA